MTKSLAKRLTLLALLGVLLLPLAACECKLASAGDKSAASDPAPAAAPSTAAPAPAATTEPAGAMADDTEEEETPPAKPADEPKPVM